MAAPAELVEIRCIAESQGLVIDDLYGYPPTFEAYLIEMRVRRHLGQLRDEITANERLLPDTYHPSRGDYLDEPGLVSPYGPETDRGGLVGQQPY